MLLLEGEFVVSAPGGSTRAKAQSQRGPGKPMTMVPINVCQPCVESDANADAKTIIGEPFQCHLIDISLIGFNFIISFCSCVS